MPLYYFHIRCDGGLIIDEEGGEHESLAAAALEAVRGARCLMSAEVEAGHLELEQAIEIFDAEGQHLSSVKFEDALRITRQSRSQRAPTGAAE